MQMDAKRLPPITLLAVIVEFFIIIFFSINATSHFLGNDPNLRLPGYEGEYLTSSATFASSSLKTFGYIPLWQPYLARGEPLIDNPFSFVLNPISVVPSLLYGSNIGMRYSVVLTAILAGLGGWTLGRMLGFGSLGRVLLGLLLLGKGNMIAMIGIGEFQLGGSQAYIPWVIAGIIGVMRLRHQRLSVVLTAVMFTLMFWAGNIYFLLPTLMSVAGLVLTHIIEVTREDEQLKFRLNLIIFRRVVLAGLLTLGLSAITLLPIFLQQQSLGGHPPEGGAGVYADLPTVVTMFFNDTDTPYRLGLVPGGAEFYQSYILPFWFALLSFIIFPILSFIVEKPSKSQMWKVASVGLVMIVFGTLWGTGQNPVIGWLYANVPLIAQWRFVGRILGIVTFWIAVLAVIQVDAFWRTLQRAHLWRDTAWIRRLRSTRIALLFLLVILSFHAASQVISQWQRYAGPIQHGMWLEDDCIEWLRQQYPDDYLSVWTSGYSEITAYMVNRVRHYTIAAAYVALGKPSALFNGDLTRLPPEYGIAWDDNERRLLTDEGYYPLINSPKVDIIYPCMWRKPDAVAYVFTVPLPHLKALNDTLPFEFTTPVSSYTQYPDQIGLLVESVPDTSLVVTVQEVAYPGWIVEVDNQPASLESVGGFLGVVLPPGDGQRQIRFAYRPPLLLFGAGITLFTALFCTVYLLRLDRFIPPKWVARIGNFTRRTNQLAIYLLTSPEIFEPRYYPDDSQPLLPAPEQSADEGEITEDDTQENGHPERQ